MQHPNTHGSLIRQHALAIAELAAKPPTDAILTVIYEHTRKIADLQAEALCELHDRIDTMNAAPEACGEGFFG